MASPAQRLRVARTAPRAQTWLRQTQQAHVLYSFERVLNLVNQEGDVLALASDRIGSGPFSLVLEPGDFPKDVQIGASLLVFENGFWLDDWLPRPVANPPPNSPSPARIIQAAEQHIPRLITGIQQGDIESISKASKG